MTRWCWRKAIGLKSPHEAGPNEIAPGVVRPSYALAGMVAGAIIAKPLVVKQNLYMSRRCFEVFFEGKVRPPHQLEFEMCSLSGDKWVGTVGGKKLEVFVKISKRNRDSYNGASTFRHLYVFFEGALFEDFLTEDEKLITEAIDKALELKKEQEENKAVSDAQQKALDIIESVFSTPEETTT